jgi:hypothetical protein
MVCISELRGLQQFQAKHPETVLVALSVEDNREAIEKLIHEQKLEQLRMAVGPDWQAKFGVSEAIPSTVIVDTGRVRVVHEGVLFDPAAILEADLAAVRAGTSASSK